MGICVLKVYGFLDLEEFLVEKRKGRKFLFIENLLCVRREVRGFICVMAFIFYSDFVS